MFQIQVFTTSFFRYPQCNCNVFRATPPPGYATAACPPPRCFDPLLATGGAGMRAPSPRTNQFDNARNQSRTDLQGSGETISKQDVQETGTFLPCGSKKISQNAPNPSTRVRKQQDVYKDTSSKR